MKKAHRKLIPAVAMLLVSAIMLSTSSFAWFSMNTEVTATGMEISAKSDGVFLVISQGTTGKYDRTATDATAAKVLYPVAPKEAAVNSTGVKTPANWQYGYSDTTDASAVNKTGYKDCAKLDHYVASSTFKIKVDSKHSGVDTVNNLKITGVTLPVGMGVIAVCGSNAVKLTETATSLSHKMADSVTIKDTEVTLYYYINGDNTSVYTDNIAKLKGQIEVTFGVDTPAAAPAPAA